MAVHSSLRAPVQQYRAVRHVEAAQPVVHTSAAAIVPVVVVVVVAIAAVVAVVVVAVEVVVLSVVVVETVVVATGRTAGSPTRQAQQLA